MLKKGTLALSELTGFQGFGKIDSKGKEKINTDPNANSGDISEWH
jgi:hypothetical protein